VRKFIAVVKREYIQRVRTKMFILVTLLAPLVISLFGIAPALIFSIKGGPVRIAVVDETGKLYGHLYNALMNGEGDAEDATNPTDNIQNTKPGEGLKGVAKSRRTDFRLEEIKPGGRSLSQIRSELDRRLQ